MSSTRDNYWSEFHHIIINYNGRNDTLLSNLKIREAINQLIMWEKVIAESNNITVDMFMVSPHRNESEDLIDKVANLTKNVGNEKNLIDKVANLTINGGNENDMI